MSLILVPTITMMMMMEIGLTPGRSAAVMERRNLRNGREGQD